MLKRLTGVDLLDDLSVFFRALERARSTASRSARTASRRCSADPATTFLVVTSPEREPVEEAIFFHGKLRDARDAVRRPRRQPRAPARRRPRARPTSRRSTAALGGDAKLAGKVARAYAEERALAERDAAAIERLRAETGEQDPVSSRSSTGDVHDVDGLVAIHAHLFAD